ncbi:MAG: hypothetical protein IJS06_05490 [Prevotella sp.]|nr:hypothetical protein [Prevotella sp.]
MIRAKLSSTRLKFLIYFCLHEFSFYQDELTKTKFE